MNDNIKYISDSGITHEISIGVSTTMWYLYKIEYFKIIKICTDDLVLTFVITSDIENSLNNYYPRDVVDCCKRLIKMRAWI